jgi:hypothetical protein
VTNSLDRQLIYFRQLDDTVRFDQQAIVNLSADIKKFARKTQESFQEVDSKFEWTSKLRASATLIRQLKFVLARLVSFRRYVDCPTVCVKWQNSCQPWSSIGTSVVSLSLPEGYELAAGLPNPDLSSYFEHVTANVLVSPTGFLLILYIPLKDVTTQFEILKTYVFPSEV